MEREKIVLFSPEYSSELSRKVKSIYKDDIQHYYPQLKLEKLIDLLEHTQYLYELYIHFVSKNKNKDALTSYIIGCFYIFLIMPQSIQFQTKNKDFGIYTDMKKLYESQMNMTNVLLIVRDEIETILDNDVNLSTDSNQFTDRQRAYSVPQEELGDSLKSLNIENIYNNTEYTNSQPRNAGNTNLNELLMYKDPPQGKDSNRSNTLSSSSSSTSTSNEDNIFPKKGHVEALTVSSDSELLQDDIEASSPLWKAPSLDPNDQLKLALFPEALPLPSIPLREDFSQPIELSPGSSEGQKTTSKPIYRSRTESVAMSMFEQPSLSNNKSLYSNIYESPNVSSELFVDRNLTHRKNSYHSVYMMDNENDEIRNDKFYDKSNDFIRGLERLEGQSIITAPELFSILSNSNERSKLLLIDLRLKKRYSQNNIIADNYVPLDPTLLWNQNSNSPIYDIKILEDQLNNKLFNERNSFEYIVYYSDMKTYMRLDFDYHFILFYLLITSLKDSDRFKGAPTALLGGFDKWKKMMHKYSKAYDVDVRQYVYGPYGKDGKKISQKSAISLIPDSEASKNLSNNQVIDPRNRVPEAPLWKPPEVPVRIRKRPPPPPPATRPKTPPVLLPEPPSIPPKLPTKIHLGTRNRISWTPNAVPVVPSTIPERKPITKLNRKYESRVAKIPKPRSYSIPTIEKNSNIYVSLSVTGLRNLGSTCYINSMMQCLFASRIFRDLFLSNDYERYIDMNNKGINQHTKGLSLSKSLNMLFKKMYLNGGCSVVPISFLKTCNILRPDLRIPDDQQDTQEFLMLILDRLHDELSKQDEIVNDNPDLLLYDTDELKVNEKEYKEWFNDNIISDGVSPIDEIFQGQMESCLQCERCGFSTYNYSSFYVLSLAIPKKQKGFTKGSKRVNLEDCIKMFTSDEILSNENSWNCPKCCEDQKKKLIDKKKRSKQMQQHLQSPTNHNEKFRDKHSIFKFGGSKRKKSKTSSRSLSPFALMKKNDSRDIKNAESFHNSLGNSSDTEYKDSYYEESDDELDEYDDAQLRQWKNKKLITVKTLNFISLPKVLVIHLSRFFYDLTKKNNTIITYPFILNIALKNHKVNKYRLYGIVNHSGNLISGHYTSLINKNYEHSLKTDEQKWYYFDDEVVKRENNHGDMDNGVNKISSKDVYVLFYERID